MTSKAILQASKVRRIAHIIELSEDVDALSDFADLLIVTVFLLQHFKEAKAAIGEKVTAETMPCGKCGGTGEVEMGVRRIACRYCHGEGK